jgi:hypothetical protein
MEWVLAVMAVAAAGFGSRMLWLRRRQRQDAAQELAVAQRMADEDTTLLGEQLQRLGAEHPVSAMDESTRVDYQTALDAYELAKAAVPRMRSVEAVSTVVDILTSGRYVLACVRARVDGRPVPERRVPCFSNPQHGPSVRDVVWTAPGRGTRTVPACAQDAARVARGESPKVRTIMVGAVRAPYWEAGAAYLPYGENYFTAAALEAGFRGQAQAQSGPGGLGG